MGNNYGRIDELKERIRKSCYCWYSVYGDEEGFYESSEVECSFDKLLQAAKDLAEIDVGAAIDALMQVAKDIASSSCHDFDIVFGLSCIAEVMAIVDPNSGEKIVGILEKILGIISDIGLAEICDEALVRISRVMIKLHERGFKVVKDLLERLLDSILEISNYCELNPEFLFNICRLLVKIEIPRGNPLFSCFDAFEFPDDFVSALKNIGVEDAVEICRKMLESEIHYIRKLEKGDAIGNFEYFMEFFTKAISIALTKLDFGEWGFQTMNYLCEFMKKTDSIEVANIVAFQLYDLINSIKRELEHENVESLDNIMSQVVIFLEKQLEVDPRSFLKRFSDHYEWLSSPHAEAWCRFFAMHEEPIIKALKSPDICFDILDISPQFSDLFLKHKIFRDVITETLRSLNPPEFFRRLGNILPLDNDIIIEITREKIAASSFDDIIVLIDAKGKWCLKNDYIRDALNNIKFGPQKIDVDDIKRAIYKEKYVSILLEFDWFVDCIISNIRTFDATTLIKMLELHVWRKQLPERLIKTIIESLASRILESNEEDAIRILRSIPNRILEDHGEICEALVRKLSLDKMNLVDLVTTLEKIFGGRLYEIKPLLDRLMRPIEISDGEELIEAAFKSNYSEFRRILCESIINNKNIQLKLLKCDYSKLASFLVKLQREAKFSQIDKILDKLLKLACEYFGFQELSPIGKRIDQYMRRYIEGEYLPLLDMPGIFTNFDECWRRMYSKRLEKIRSIIISSSNNKIRDILLYTCDRMLSGDLSLREFQEIIKDIERTLYTLHDASLAYLILDLLTTPFELTPEVKKIHEDRYENDDIVSHEEFIADYSLEHTYEALFQLLKKLFYQGLLDVPSLLNLLAKILVQPVKYLVREHKGKTCWPNESGDFGKWSYRDSIIISLETLLDDTILGCIPEIYLLKFLEKLILRVTYFPLKLLHSGGQSHLSYFIGHDERAVIFYNKLIDKIINLVTLKADQNRFHMDRLYKTLFSALCIPISSEKESYGEGDVDYESYASIIKIFDRLPSIRETIIHLLNRIIKRYGIRINTLLHLTRILIDFYKTLRDNTYLGELIEFIIHRKADKTTPEGKYEESIYVAKYYIYIEDYHSSEEEIKIIVDKNIERMKKPFSKLRKILEKQDVPRILRNIILVTISLIIDCIELLIQFAR